MTHDRRALQRVSLTSVNREPRLARCGFTPTVDSFRSRRLIRPVSAGPHFSRPHPCALLPLRVSHSFCSTLAHSNAVPALERADQANAAPSTIGAACLVCIATFPAGAKPHMAHVLMTKRSILRIPTRYRHHLRRWCPQTAGPPAICSDVQLAHAARSGATAARLQHTVEWDVKWHTVNARACHRQ